jgi:tripartite-type tricarboxylate transporter receptor subunit TctC
MFQHARRGLIGLGLAALVTGGAAAQTAPAFPQRPVTMVVGFAPGGPADVIARLIAPAMAADLGQPVVVENASGAGGSIGQARVAAARPDGHTILFGSLAQATIPTIYRNLSFDPLALEAIGLVNEVPMTIIARRNFPAANLAEMVAVVRREGRRLNLGNAGVGSTSHLCSLLLLSSIGTPVTLVPYRGNALAMNDLMSGTLDLSCDQTTNNAEQVRAGVIRGYAITTASRTSALLATLQDGAVTRRMVELGSLPAAGERTTPEGAQAFWRAEVTRWRPLIEAAGQFAD